MVRKRGLLSAVTAVFLVNLRKIKAKQYLGKRPILPEAPSPGKQNRAPRRMNGRATAYHPAGIC
jgi:hypothetical protein